MKKILLVSLFAGTMALASCGYRYNNPQDMAVKVMQGVKGQSASMLEGLLPTTDVINEVYANNPLQVGYAYTNKYTPRYRREYLVGKIKNSLGMIETISKENELDWSTAQFSGATEKAVSEDGKSFTEVTIPVKFGNNAIWNLKYHAVRSGTKWFLFDDIDFVTPPVEE